MAIIGLYLVYEDVQTCNLQQASEYLNIGRFFFFPKRQFSAKIPKYLLDTGPNGNV